jgi:hypothetical protein
MSASERSADIKYLINLPYKSQESASCELIQHGRSNILAVFSNEPLQ